MVSLNPRVQLIVVDLEEPRSLRATIGWPASGAMRILHTNLLESAFCWTLAICKRKG
jgi:hypothetical protein